MREKLFAIGTLGLATLLASFGTSVANIALPTLAQFFEAPFSQVQAVVIAYLATLTLSVVVAGRLGDRLGMKRMLTAGLGIFLVSASLCAIAPSLPVLVLARAMQGIGAAFMMTLAMALVRQTADGAPIGQAMGILGTTSAVGTALGPSIGGLLIHVGSWQGIFWAQAPLTALALALVYFFLPRDPVEATQPAIPPLSSALSQGLVGNLFANLLVAAVMMTTLIVGPFYLTVGLELEPVMVGLLMAIGPTISILSGLPSGYLVDAWGDRFAIRTGLGMLGVGTLMLATLPQIVGIAGYISAMMLLTPGYQLFQAANNTRVLLDVPNEHRGATAGLLSVARNLGLLGGTFVMGAIFVSGAGTSDVAKANPSAIASGMQLVFASAAVLVLLALVGVSRR